MLAETKFKPVCQLHRKKNTILAASALKIKDQKKQIQTNIETPRLNRLEQKLTERATEKVVYNVKQRLTATVATKTESPRAAPTKTVEVQVNLEKEGDSCHPN